MRKWNSGRTGSLQRYRRVMAGKRVVYIPAVNETHGDVTVTPGDLHQVKVSMC